MPNIDIVLIEVEKIKNITIKNHIIKNVTQIFVDINKILKRLRFLNAAGVSNIIGGLFESCDSAIRALQQISQDELTDDERSTYKSIINMILEEYLKLPGADRTIGSKEKANVKFKVGTGDFKETILSECCFFDTSLLIKAVIDDDQLVKVITRPKGFGKSLNLSMIKYFFDINDAKSNRELFNNLKISQHQNIHYIVRCQGQYPVVFLNFKDLVGYNFDVFEEQFREMMRNVYVEHQNVDQHLHVLDRREFEAIVDKKSTLGNLKFSLRNLLRYLNNAYGKRVMVLIDEYHNSEGIDCCQPVIDFIGEFLRASLKDNDNLYMAIMVGMLRGTSGGAMWGLNNITLYSVLSDKYSEYFGVTQQQLEELRSLSSAKDLPEKVKAIDCQYGGYQVGSKNVLCSPRAITRIIRDAHTLESEKFKDEWVATSEVNIITRFIGKYKNVLEPDLKKLLNNIVVHKRINEHLRLKAIFDSPENIWTFLLSAGLLTFIPEGSKKDLYALTIPNKEVYNFFIGHLKESKIELEQEVEFKNQNGIPSFKLKNDELAIEGHTVIKKRLGL